MSILSAIMGVESGGGHNVTQGNIGDINNRTGDLAQGYYQITGATWADFGGGATGYHSALAAPYATQLQIAQNIPVSRWGPASQLALNQQGYFAQPGETLGHMLTRYGEDPNATTPADGSSPSGSGSVIAQGPVIDPGTGLPASVTDTPGATTSGASGPGSGTQGQQVNVGLQTGFVAEIQKWLTTTFGAIFDNIQNWFVRAFLIIVGIIILAIGLLKITGTDKIVVNMAKDAVAAA